MFPDKLRVSSFQDRVQHFAGTATQSAHSDFVGSWVYACLGVTRHLRFWQNDRGLLRATAVSRGVERTPNKIQNTKLTLEKNILKLFLRDSNSQPFHHESGALTNNLRGLLRIKTSNVTFHNGPMNLFLHSLQVCARDRGKRCMNTITKVAPCLVTSTRSLPLSQQGTLSVSSFTTFMTFR